MINNSWEFQSGGFSSPTHLPGPLTPGDSQKRPLEQVTLFQWQIQREEQKVAGMSASQLGMQDADGDTWVSRGQMSRTTLIQEGECAGINTGIIHEPVKFSWLYVFRSLKETKLCVV